MNEGKEEIGSDWELDSLNVIGKYFFPCGLSFQFCQDPDFKTKTRACTVGMKSGMNILETHDSLFIIYIFSFET